MGKIDKLYSKMKRNPKDVTFKEIETICKHFGCYVENYSGGSHYSIGHLKVQESIIVPRHDPIKQIYVKRALNLIDKIMEKENET